LLNNLQPEKEGVDRSRTRQEYLAKGVFMRSKRVLACGFVACLIASVVVVIGPGAQYTLAQTEKASISGRITDQSNAVMPDAEVELKNTDTGIVTVTKTNDQGVYVFPSLARAIM